MVTKFKGVDAICCTGKENLLLLAGRKAKIYDLETKSIVSEIKVTGGVGIFANVGYENYLATDSEPVCIIDLDRMEVVHKFSTYGIYKFILKNLLNGKYRKEDKKTVSDGYDVDNFHCYAVDLNKEKLVLEISYTVFGRENYAEKNVDLAEFETGSWKYIGHKNVAVGDKACSNYLYQREFKYPFLCYDREKLNQILERLNLETCPENLAPIIQRYFRNSVLYYPKYNVLIYKDCLYGLDGNYTEPVDELPADDEFRRKGFDAEKYLSENGVTDKALKYLSPELILEEGFSRALNSLEKKSEELNIKIKDILTTPHVTEEEYLFYQMGSFDLMVTDDGFGEFFEDGDDGDFNELIKVLNLIGAKQTVKVVKKCIAMAKKYRGDKHAMGEHFDELVSLAEDIEDDYVELTVNYVKSKRGIARS